MGVLIRGPLAKGVLSGKYDRSSVFEDTVRSVWNEGGAGRTDFERRMNGLEKLLASLRRESLAETAIRFTASHPAAPVSIPGRKVRAAGGARERESGRMAVYARTALPVRRAQISTAAQKAGSFFPKKPRPFMVR